MWPRLVRDWSNRIPTVLMGPALRPDKKITILIGSNKHSFARYIVDNYYFPVRNNFRDIIKVCWVGEMSSHLDLLILTSYAKFGTCTTSLR